MGVEVKDDLGSQLNGTNPEVMNTVLAKISGVQDNVKAMKDSVMKDFEDFKTKNTEALGKGLLDTAKKEELDKIQTSFLTKFEAMQKSHTDRCDAIEVAMKRSGRGGIGSEKGGDADFLEAKEFTRTMLARKNQLERHYVPDEKVDVESFRNYKQAFVTFLCMGKEGLEANEIKALSTGKDPAGGYLVRPAISNRVTEKIIESSPMRELSTVEVIGTDRLQIGIDIDEAGAEWVGEVTPKPRNETSTPGIKEKEIVVRELSAKPMISQNDLDDSTRDMEAWLIRKVGSKFGRSEATAFINGNGINKPHGILGYAAGTNCGQVEQINTGATSGLTYDGVMDIITGLKEAYHGRATWLMRRTSLAQAMKVQDGDNSYIFAPMFREGRNPFQLTILGYPIRMASDMPGIASNALSYAFGDFMEGYTIVDRQGMRVLRDPFTADPMVVFKTYKRVGGGVVNFESIKIGKCA